MYFNHFGITFAVGTYLFSMVKQLWDRLYNEINVYI
jgi:hypothetical protein